MSAKSLPEHLWHTIQSSVPIACVDIAPLRRAPDGSLQLGLVLRSAPNDELRWCFIGGRLQLDETSEQAISRELDEALGGSLRRTARVDPPPLLLEYSRTFRPGELYDPRQHAVSLTFPLWLDGEGVARGAEAKQFRWWNIDELDAHTMGFGQESVLGRLRAAAEARPA